MQAEFSFASSVVPSSAIMCVWGWGVGGGVRVGGDGVGCWVRVGGDGVGCWWVGMGWGVG